METYRRLLGAKTNPPKDKLPCGLLGSGHFFHYAYVPALNKTNSPLAATGIFLRDERKLREAQRFLRHALQPFATQEDLFASGIKAAFGQLIGSLLTGQGFFGNSHSLTV